MSQATEKDLLQHIASMYEILEECFVYSHIDSDGNKGVEWIMQWMIRVLPLIPADAWSDAGPWLDIQELLARYKRSGTFRNIKGPMDWDRWARDEIARIEKFAEERKADTPPEKSAFNKTAFLPHMHRSENDFRPPVQYELSPKDYLVLMGED